MPNDGVVDKVAARLTLDISPAQKAMLQMSDDYQQMNKKMLQADTSGSNVLLQNLTQKQQKLLQRQEEFALKKEAQQKLLDQRLEMNAEQHNQKLLQSERIYQEKLKQMQGAGRSQGNVFGGPIGNLTERAIGAASGIAIYQIISEITKIPAIAFQAEASLTKLKQVLELTPAQADLQSYGSLDNILKQLNQTAGVMAQTYGVDLNVVIDAMSMVGRKFKDVAEIVVATDTALQMYAVDNVPVETAVKSLEALMSQFNLSMKESRQALFELTAAAHAFQVTGTDLMTAIERSGSAFSTMKMNTAESIAAIATLAQMTAQSGSTIGNAWKSIENSFQSDKGVKAMHQLGIEVFDANGKLNDSMTILTKLQTVWPKLSDQAKAHFATVLAGGRYQYGRLEAFLNDYTNQYQRALDTIKQANAKQQEELVATALESPVKQLEMTKASFEVLANTITQNVTPALIAFMTEIRQGTRNVEEHWGNIKKWISVGASLAEGYIAWRVILGTWNALVQTTTLKQFLLNAELAKTQMMSGGFTAGLATMRTGLIGLGTAAAATVGKLAALLAIVTVFNNIVARAADPLQAKEDDLKGQIDILEKRRDSKSLGDAFLEGLSPYKDILNPAKFHQESIMSKEPGITPLNEHIDELKKDLWNVQSQRQQQQADEIKKSMDEINKIIEEQMNKIPPSPKGPPDDGTKLNPDPSSKKSGAGGTSAYLEPFRDLTSGYKSQLDPFTQAVSSSSASIRMLNAQVQGLNASTRDGILTQSQMNELRDKENQTIQELTSHQKLLHLEHEAIEAMLPNLAAQMEEVNRQYDAGTISASEHRQAIDNLRSEYDSMTQKMNDNSVQWYDDATKIAEAEDKVTAALKKQNTAVEEKLKAGYESEKQYQVQQLDDQYKQQTDAIKDQVTALDNQKKGIDGVIASLREQWKQQDDNNKLSELQKERTQVMSQLDHEIVGLDGKLTRTYDVAKVTELDKKIADELTRISHDAQIKQLEDQKTGIDKQIEGLHLQEQAIKDTYDKQKQDLDDYWNYRMSQDQLKAEADRMILKSGYDKALVDAQSFVNQMNSLMASIHAPGVSAGGAVSAGLGQINPGSSYGSGGHEYGMSDDDYRQFRQNSEDWFHSSTEDQQKLSAANDAMRDKYGIPQGVIPKLKLGGKVPNIGSGGTDSVLSLLTPGEIVAPSFEDIVKSFTPKMLQMDSGVGQTTHNTYHIGQVVANNIEEFMESVNHFKD